MSYHLLVARKCEVVQMSLTSLGAVLMGVVLSIFAGTQLLFFAVRPFLMRLSAYFGWALKDAEINAITLSLVAVVTVTILVKALRVFAGGYTD